MLDAGRGAPAHLPVRLGRAGEGGGIHGKHSGDQAAQIPKLAREREGGRRVTRAEGWEGKKFKLK